LAVTGAVLAAEKPRPEELVKQHLQEGLGGAVLPAGQLRDIRGTASVTTPARASGTLTGSFRFVSSASASRVVVKFGATDLYEGEGWETDGTDVQIAFAQPRTSSRSAVGIFLWMNKVIVGEGLLGGVLNARWPLLDLQARGAKITYDGLKKLQGRELHRLRYRARSRQGPLDVLIFLEPSTSRHVATVYTSSQAQGMGARPETSSREEDLVFRLEEGFSDFERFGSATLPRTWTLRYERLGNTSSEWKYELELEGLEERDLKTGGLPRTAAVFTVGPA
jgi:hypothetical protein